MRMSRSGIPARAAKLTALGATVVAIATICGPARSGTSVSYQYDAAGRLKNATYCQGATAHKLDAAGNRVTVTTSVVGVGDVLSFVTFGAPISPGQTIQVEVDRLCPSNGAVSATYSTSGTAPATDYSVSGSLSWAAGDFSPKYLTLTFSSSPSIRGDYIDINMTPASPASAGAYRIYELEYDMRSSTQPITCGSICTQ